jgi:transposase
LSRGDLSEAEWRLLEPLLPPERGRKSRLAFDNRQIVNGILWRIRTGAPWRDLPEKYGKWMTVHQRFRRWSEAGIWEAVATTLAQAMADNSRHSLDSTTVRGHVSAAGAKGGLANKLLAVRGVGSPVKFHCLSDARGNPLVFHLTLGEAANSSQRDN